MSTPEFVSSSQSLATVRYYTELDPYYYTVDNRPLEDLASNIQSSVNASDAGRIASLIGGLQLSATIAGMFGGSSTNPRTLGLVLTNPATGQVSLSAGVLTIQDAINSSDSRTVTKIAASPIDQTLSTPHPVTVGTEIYYLIEVNYASLASGSTFPYYVTNPHLDSSLAHGELKVNVVAGVKATIGSGVVPTGTAGWYPLYVVQAKAGDTTVTITRPASTPNLGVVSPGTWSAPALTNSWANFGGTTSPAGYRRVLGGVALRGAIKSGTIGQAAFTLPTWMRPPYDVSLPTVSNGAFGSVTITAAGAVIPSVGSNTSFYLDSVFFPIS